MRLVDANVMDVAYVCRHMRQADADEVMATRFDDDRDRFAMSVMAWSVAWVAWDDEKPVAVIGAYEVWPGMWMAGMVATDKFQKVGRGLTRFVKRGMIPLLKELGMRRAEAKSMEGHDVAHRWLEALGARREGAPHTKYGKGGETFHTYVWEF